MSQIQRFIQVLNKTMSDIDTQRGKNKNVVQLKDEVNIKVEQINELNVRLLDMGCGKGYLTMAAHHFLMTNRYNVQTLGLDLREKLITEANRLSDQSLDYADSLKFEKVAIDEYLALRLAERNNTESKSTEKYVFYYYPFISLFSYRVLSS